MKTPRFVMGAAMVFWGGQNDLLTWALPMALILETSHFSKERWELSISDLNRIWNLCAVLFGSILLFLYTNEDQSHLAFKFAQWQPFAFYPMILAQVFGTWEKIPLTVFSWFLRRAPQNPLAKKSANISYSYFALCLLAASAADEAGSFFYPGLVALLAVALFVNRPKRVSPAFWISMILLIAGAGEISHRHLRQMQSKVEGTLSYWLSTFFRRSDPSKNRTFIGEIGRLKLSGKIVIRLQAEGAPPPLLREASYDSYFNGLWRASSNSWQPVSIGTNDIAVLLPRKRVRASARISRYLDGGKGLLPIPHGAFELDELPISLLTNRFGVARSDGGPGMVNFLAQYGPGVSFDEPPGTNDMAIPVNEKPALEQIADELKFERKTDREKIKAIEKFFGDKFTYTTDIKPWFIDRTGKRTPIGQFLTKSRTGHCEYFATATVLLLRQAGIPARYATGYAVEESAFKHGTYVVRERHAHAWTLVWFDKLKRWEEFDTTPASWDAAEAERASWWEPVSDFLSNLTFQYSKWRWSKTSYLQYVQWLLIPLVGFLAWRIVSQKRRKRLAAEEKNSAGDPVWPGLDSELFLVEKQLAAADLGRQPNELVGDWKKRLAQKNLPQLEKLEPIFTLHYRLRFDPHGLNRDDRKALRQQTENWLKEFTQRQEKRN